MIFKNSQTFTIRVNGIPAKMDVFEKEGGYFCCLFNKEIHKDFINGLGVLGFVVVITVLETREDFFYPIPIKSNHILTNELMEIIWDQIEGKRVELNKISSQIN